MLRSMRAVVCLAGLVVSACGGPPVVADSRGPFDTVSGLYGGNEFSPLSTEGKRTFAGDPPDKAGAAAPAKPVVAPAPASVPPAATAGAAVPAVPVVVAAATPVVQPAAHAPPAAPILIEPNAFSAVFPGATGPVQPSAEQLMQLDSITFLAVDPVRTELQRKILACRHAGADCRLAAH